MDELYISTFPAGVENVKTISALLMSDVLPAPQGIRGNLFAQINADSHTPTAPMQSVCCLLTRNRATYYICQHFSRRQKMGYPKSAWWKCRDGQHLEERYPQPTYQYRDMLTHNPRDVRQFLPRYIKSTKHNTLPLHHRKGHCRQGEGER